MDFLLRGEKRKTLFAYTLLACVILFDLLTVTSWDSYYVRSCWDDLEDCQNSNSGSGLQKQKDDAIIMDLRKQIKAHEATIATLTTQTQKCDAEIATLKTEKLANQATIATLTTQTQMCDAETATLKTEKQAIEATIATLTTQTQKCDAEIAILKTEKQANEATIATLTTQTQKCDAETATLKTEKQANEAAIATLTTQTQKCDAEITTLKTEKQGNEATIAALEKQKLADSNTISTLQTQKLADDKTVTTLHNQILALTINWPAVSKSTAREQEFKDGDFTIKLSLACENLVATLDCSAVPNTVIQLISAAYGYPDDPGCGTTKSQFCQRDVLSKLLDPANNFALPPAKPRWTVVASNGHFGDPCTGAVKSLEIFYQCVPS